MPCELSATGGNRIAHAPWPDLAGRAAQIDLIE